MVGGIYQPGWWAVISDHSEHTNSAELLSL